MSAFEHVSKDRQETDIHRDAQHHKSSVEAH